MFLSKPFFEGLGTGSGVAWPLFGILFSTLSIGVGSTFAITLGSICSVLFMLISLPIFYSSYTHSQDEENKLNGKLSAVLNTLMANTKKIIKDDLLTVQSDIASKRIGNFGGWSKQKEFNNAYFRMLITIHYSSQLPAKEKNQSLDRAINNFANNMKIRCQQSIKPGTLLYQGFLGFVGAFGSVAGCSAGLMGMLAALGIVSGFSAIPPLGIAMLVVAVSCGIYSAFTAAGSLQEKNSKKELYKKVKILNNSLKNYQIIKNMENKLRNPERSPENHSNIWRSNTIFVNPAESSGMFKQNRISPVIPQREAKAEVYFYTLN